MVEWLLSTGIMYVFPVRYTCKEHLVVTHLSIPLVDLNTTLIDKISGCLSNDPFRNRFTNLAL
jgi:hypothetical protein